MGWIIVHDHYKRLGTAVTGLRNMCGRILGTNTIIQGALPDILTKTPQCYFDGVIKVLHVSEKILLHNSISLMCINIEHRPMPSWLTKC